jgi:hypothetical protein
VASENPLSGILHHSQVPAAGNIDSSATIHSNITSTLSTSWTTVLRSTGAVDLSMVPPKVGSTNGGPVRQPGRLTGRSPTNHLSTSPPARIREYPETITLAGAIPIFMQVPGRPAHQTDALIPFPSNELAVCLYRRPLPCVGGSHLPVYHIQPPTSKS